jgi:hypothetical protein
MFSDKTEPNCQFQAAGRNCHKKCEVDFVFIERYLTRVGKNLLALGAEKCSSSQKRGTTSSVDALCNPLYHALESEMLTEYGVLISTNKRLTKQYAGV